MTSASVIVTSKPRLRSTDGQTPQKALEYYGACLTPLFNSIAAGGVKIVDYDLFAANNSVRLGQFDAVLAMAVLEHYPHSPKCFMDNVSALLAPKGCVYIDVPNIAYWGMPSQAAAWGNAAAPDWDYLSIRDPVHGTPPRVHAS